MVIKPINKVNVSEQVFNQLKKAIIEGEWKPGDKIPSENELASSFGVSRMTVRQSLQKLIALGLIETKLGDGSYVRVLEAGDSLNALMPAMYLNKDSFLDVIEFREMIETESAGLAAIRSTGEQLTELKNIYTRMLSNKNNIKKFAMDDLAFHCKIGEMTGNELIIKTYALLDDILEAAMYDGITKMGTEYAEQYHQLLIDSIEAHDELKAREYMKKHLMNNREYYK
ncbi:GntR family transcriptional regulator [Anaerocolumna sedimenticola]|uniref:GntR family transcriptional regulator n=1 Tax=Anaerocolumna sedimenticola TaxID=2696063 RepID=A0A6P1TUC4_9FIRM|nr:FadR/GntR family transcriptional regulator [Anaerocolumna sedimenticola]QHQ63088.1 GntR family transcriptional regulator [Anaerocolumna sedimenticola]